MVSELNLRRVELSVIMFYKDKQGEWRWRLKARNGKVLADSGEGYKRYAGAEKGARAMIKIILVAYERLRD